MPTLPIAGRVALPWRHRGFLGFTLLTALACPVLIWWLDQPLALWLHRYAAGVAPLFEAGTALVDKAYQATNIGGRPTLLIGLGLAYLLGRWGLRQRGATVLLLILLTHVCSVASASMLQVAVHRPRPEVLFAPGAAASFSFPSLHTATYWSLFWPLVVAFPRYRLPLLAVPVFIALGRLVLGAHYLSDVWVASWLAVAWAALWQAARRVASWGWRNLRTA